MGNSVEMEPFSRYWPFVRGIHQSLVDSLHKTRWRGALVFSLIYVWTNGWANTCGAGDLRCHRVHVDVTIMMFADVIWARGHQLPWWFCCGYIVTYSYHVIYTPHYKSQANSVPVTGVWNKKMTQIYICIYILCIYIIPLPSVPHCFRPPRFQLGLNDPVVTGGVAFLA